MRKPHLRWKLSFHAQIAPTRSLPDGYHEMLQICHLPSLVKWKKDQTDNVCLQPRPLPALGSKPVLL